MIVSVVETSHYDHFILAIIIVLNANIINTITMIIFCKRYFVGPVSLSLQQSKCYKELQEVCSGKDCRIIMFPIQYSTFIKSMILDILKT